MSSVPGSLYARILSVTLSIALAVGSVGAYVPQAAASEPLEHEVLAAPPEPVVVRELVEKRTESTRDFLLSNGNTRVEYHAGPIHYRDKATGRFEAIDATLLDTVIDGKPAAVNRANSFRLALPARLGTGAVTVETSACAVSISPASHARSGEATPSSDAIAARSDSVSMRTYAGAFTDADLAYESTPEGVKETIVLDSKPAASSFAFDMTLRGLEPRSERDGSISLVRPGGQAVFTIPRPFMVDSSGRPDGDDYSDAVRYELSGEAPTYRLVVGADPGWLADPTRVYPVRIDPTIHTTADNPSDTFVSSHYQSTNYISHHTVWIDSGTYTEYGLYQPDTMLMGDMATKKASGHRVVASELKVNAYDISHAGDVKAYMCATSTACYLSTVTWNNKPSTVATLSTATQYISSGGWKYFDVTGMTEYWQRLGLPYTKATLWLHPLDAGNAHIGFHSANYSTPSLRPLWTIDYSSVPTVALTSPTTGTVTTLPDATWDYSDEHTQTQVAYEVQIATDTTAPYTTIEGTGETTTCALTEPSGGWAPGETYLVRVRAASSPTPETPRLWSEWSSWGSFTWGICDPVSDVSVSTTASVGWFEEADSDVDGVNDARNDSDTSGRGSMSLSWVSARGATGYGIYLFDGYAYRQVATTTAISWTSAGAGVFPTDSAIASMSSQTTENPFVSVAGCDFRDDPRPLYAKTAGASMDATPSYLVRVVPYNDLYTRPVTDNAERTVTLEGRTVHLSDEPDHTEHSLGTLGIDEASVRFDEGGLTLDSTDLQVASWGPEVGISRHWSSESTNAGLFAPGWRFSFEERLDVTTPTATWIDGNGEPRVFRLVAGSWVAPEGCFETLAAASSPTGASWAITDKAGTARAFDASGALLAVTDRHDNAVTYTRTDGDITITAANGQYVFVNTEAGKVTSATWVTPSGSRSVAYDLDGDVAHVTRFPETSATLRADYTYETGRITAVGVPAVEATWAVGYGSAGTTFSVENVSGAPTPSMRRDVAIDVALRTGTVGTAYGETRYDWNPVGTCARNSAEGSATLLTHTMYDSRNLAIREVGPTGKTTSRVHDARGNVVASTDESGRTTRYTYDSHDDCVREIAPNGAVTDRTCDEWGQVIREQRDLTAAGARSRTDYEYDTVGHTTRETSLISTGSGEICAVTDHSSFADNGEPQTTIQRGVALSATSTPVDITTSVQIDGFGSTLGVTDGEGAVTASSTYDAAGRVTLSRDASGVITHTLYDALGNVTETWKSHDATTARIEWRTTSYNAASLPVTETVLDAVGNVVSTVVHSYDDDGRDVASDDSLVPGVATTAYDERSNETTTFSEGAGSADACSVRTEYDTDGNEVEVLQPGAETWATETTYTADGQVALEQRPDGSVTDYDYTDDGELESESVPTDEGTATTGYGYDLDGQVTEQTDPDDSVTSFTYDLAGRQLSAGITTPSATSYNVLGWSLVTTDSDGVATQFRYDKCGRVIAQTVGGLTTTHDFDATGREMGVTNPDGSAISNVFDVFGRIIETIETATDGSTAHRWIVTCDAAGREILRQDTATGMTRATSYAENGSVTTDETRGDFSQTSVADGTGLVTSRAAVVAGTDVNWWVVSTDTARRVVSWAYKTLDGTVHLSYDQAGRPYLADSVAPWVHLVQPATYPPSGDGEARDTDSSPYRYDPATGRKSGERFGFDFAQRAEDATFTYTIDGRLAYSSRNASSTTYQYDPSSGALSAYRPSGAATVTLSYDASGHVTAAGTRRYSSDLLGRRVNAGTAANTRETTLTWTGERLVGLSKASSVAATHAYDPSGQRIRSVVREGSLVTTTTWHYDGIALSGLDATRSDGTTFSLDYVRDEKGDLVIGIYADTTTAPKPFLMVTTDRGDVRELLDYGRNAFAFYGYDEYGNPTEIASAATGTITTALAAKIASRQPMRYAGYCWDAHSALYYCSARYYDPVTASFASKDPAEADGEESAYQYCGGEPVGKVDPSGLYASYGTFYGRGVISAAKSKSVSGLGINAWQVLLTAQYEIWMGNCTCHIRYGSAKARLKADVTKKKAGSGLWVRILARRVKKADFGGAIWLVIMQPRWRSTAQLDSYTYPWKKTPVEDREGWRSIGFVSQWRRSTSEKWTSTGLLWKAYPSCW